MEKTYSKNYHILNEIFNAITHGIGLGLAITGLVLLLVRSEDAWQTVAFAIYGSSLVLLFLFSTLAHSLYFTPAQKVFQVFDHNGIYLLIAGTYTPYCLVSLNHSWLGWIILSLVWISAIVGIVLTSIFLPKWNHVPKSSTILYIVMGWAILLALYPLWQVMGHTGFWLLLAGGVTYTVGALIYRYKFPFAHVIWHLFVLAAAMMMWFSVYFFVH